MMKKLFILMLVTLSPGCHVDTEESFLTSYDAIISDGWITFSQTNYATALESFTSAKDKYPDSAVVYSGLGWCYMKLNDLPQADSEFSAGSSKPHVSADLYAGWSFVLNALKDYATSNAKIDQTIASNPSWSFPFATNVSISDLKAMKAENYFMMGDFASSLSAVQVLNPIFTANVFSDAGVAALAVEIERLKRTN